MSTLVDVTHRVLGSTDCTTAGCPNEADGDDGRCSQCRDPRLKNTPLLNALEGAAGERVPARAVRSDSLHLRDQPKEEPMDHPQCKHHGCASPVKDTRGIYAGLCETHKQEQRAIRAIQTRASGVSSPSEPETAVRGSEAAPSLGDDAPEAGTPETTGGGSGRPGPGGRGSTRPRNSPRSRARGSTFRRRLSARPPAGGSPG